MTVRAEERRAGVAIDRANRQRDDFYPTPPEGTRALLAVEQFDGAIWEPACGDGAMSRVLEEAGHAVVSSDLVDRGYGQSRIDFLLEWQPRAPNIVTNPPYGQLVGFMRQALLLSTGKVALLLRLTSLAGIERRAIFETSPLARVWVFSRRLQIWRNGEVTSTAGSMVDLAWFVWAHGHQGPAAIGWLPDSKPPKTGREPT